MASAITLHEEKPTCEGLQQRVADILCQPDEWSYPLEDFTLGGHPEEVGKPGACVVHVVATHTHGASSHWLTLCQSYRSHKGDSLLLCWFPSPKLTTELNLCQLHSQTLFVFFVVIACWSFTARQHLRP